MIKYLHIMSNDKFNTSYIKFIENNFNMKEHYFIFISGVSENKIPILDRNNIWKISSKKEVFKLIKLMNKSSRIFLHGLFNKNIVRLLFVQPWLLKKCSWIIWGGDLYYYKYRDNNWKSNIYEWIRSKVIKRFDSIIAYARGDFEFAKKWYKVKGEYQECLYYPYFAVNDYLKNIKLPSENSMETVIQLGNSADPRNRHIEALQNLEKFRNENIKIVCPLSYGGTEDYIRKVKRVGEKIFEDKFVTMDRFLPEEEYYKFLSNVDIAIFNHDRQQATGNILSLLYFGKKIYINKKDNSTTWNYLMQHNFIFYDFDHINLEKLSIENKNKNKKIIKQSFTFDQCKNDWNKIL
ncbi:TDP-N-acetylfucosamine:lipid II N-acetylfucosaminyltransferase [Halanaerocella petrolearia]